MEVIVLNVFIQGIRIFFIYGWGISILLLSGLGLGAGSALFLFRHTKYDDRIVYVLLLGFVWIGLAAPALALVHILNRVTVSLITLAGMAAFVGLIRQGAFS